MKYILITLIIAVLFGCNDVFKCTCETNPEQPETSDTVKITYKSWIDTGDYHVEWVGENYQIDSNNVGTEPLITNVRLLNGPGDDTVYLKVTVSFDPDIPDSSQFANLEIYINDSLAVAGVQDGPGTEKIVSVF